MQWSRAIIASLCVGAVAVGSAAVAQRKLTPAPPSALVTALDRCRKIADATQRLACFDSAAGALVAAANSGEIRVVDRAQIQQAKRSLFGFSMPKLSLFSGDSDDDKVDRLDTTIKSVEQLSSGHYRIVLAAEDAVWMTSEAKLNFDPPRKGQKITILAGPLGSYFLRINGQNGVRGRRVS